ncbi:MAG TPA: hypothetical protein PLX89_24940 [Verrucomicrobiota bacterium]|nr:hypothetical protein [Verrucomicrobiales bacterium]HRI16256.1 hypothetical protein [Verrucomicrobiota bacterium]
MKQIAYLPGTGLFILILLVFFNLSCKNTSGLHGEIDHCAQLFAKNKGRLEELLKMIQQDEGLTRVGVDWTRPQNAASVGVSEERLATYRGLFKQSGTLFGIEVTNNRDVIEFIVNSHGLGTSGYAIGLAYIRDASELNVVGDLKSLPVPPREAEYFQRLESNWYIFYDVRR